MCEYEIIFCKALHDKLREKIRGRIWVGVNDDDRLFVDITQREINTAELIVKGYSVEDACKDVIIHYRRMILKRSFK